MDFQHIDIQSIQLIIELQLADLESAMKGKHKEGGIPDAEFAMETLKSELESLARCTADQVMCRSIAQAVNRDGDAIASHTELEEQAHRDRALALRRGPANSAPTKSVPEKPSLDKGMLQKLKALSTDQEAAPEATVAESSSWAAKRAEISKSKTDRIECIACGDRVSPSNAARCPCSHEYCQDCLTELVKASITDESLFPPRCCSQRISLEIIQPFLPTTVVEEFREKGVEYSTPNRTYCHHATCSTFIPPSSIAGDAATCPKCRERTCAICKGALHQADCPQDEAAQEVLRIAAENGWQRCRSCKRMVELEVGCNHITCRCGAQFCYSCGEPWKNCSCAQWNEERLYARANAIVNRDHRQAGINVAVRERLVRRARDNLVQNHQCNHGTWSYRSGRHQCEECHDTLPSFIFECNQCRIMACRRCRYNRL